MRYWFLDIGVRQGDQETRNKAVEQSMRKEEFDSDEYVREWYGQEGDKLKDGQYSFDDGCIIISLYACNELTRAEYNVLKKFL